LAEGDWSPEAYQQALRRAWARSHAWDAKHLRTAPEELEQEAFDCQDAEPLGFDLPASASDVPALGAPELTEESKQPLLGDEARRLPASPSDDKAVEFLPSMRIGPPGAAPGAPAASSE
jgi:hypothetical protein